MTGQIGAAGSNAAALRPRNLPLRGIALAGSLLIWIAMAAVAVSVMVWHARESIRNETESAFLLAKAAATISLPTAFQRQDLMAGAARIASDIRAQRHVSAELRGADGQPVALPAALTTTLSGPLAEAMPAAQPPRWFSDLLRPPAMQDMIPIMQYPNLQGMLTIRSDPTGAIAEAWRNLGVLVPLLLATGLIAVAATMALTMVVLARLNGMGAALERMRQGDLAQSAPRSRLAELDHLAEGINTLASHLAGQRAENRQLQDRMLTLAEAERARIATDLHDEIGPQLFALRAAVEQAGRHATTPDEAESLAAISRHSEAIRKSARDAIDDLRPGPGQGGSLGDAISEMVIDFEDSAAHVAFDLRMDEPLPDMAPAMQIAIYRFLRESVLNALRHAAPGHIAISLTSSPSGIRALVSDDGSGPRPGGRQGLGHGGMRDRAALIGAQWLPPARHDGRTITELRIASP